MHVLLISPLDPKKPSSLKLLMGGENTYTTNLLKNPPRTVTYTHVSEAIKKKYVSFTFWQVIFRFLIFFRILPPDAGYYCIKLHKQFDIIHSHVYCLKIDGNIKPPVIVSDSSSNYIYLSLYLGINKTVISLWYWIRKKIAILCNIYDQNVNTKDAILLVWSLYALKIHKRFGSKKNIFVVSPGFPKQNKTAIIKSFTILFIGTWFVRKGGLLLFEAYKIVKKKYPFVTLVVVGEVPKNITIPKDTDVYSYLPHYKIESLFLKSSVLVLVPPKAEGFGVTVLEAASYGIVSIVSKVGALMELIEDEVNGYVVKPNDVTSLVKALEKLITNKSLLLKMSKNAKKNLEQKYALEKTNALLLKYYKKAIL